jgi:uncharacterized protein
VDCDGNFSSFSPELLGLRSAEYGDFVLGNVHRDAFDDAATAARVARMDRAIGAGIERCRRDCSYFRLCGGGAPANKWYENADLRSSETLYCRSMIQRPFNAVLGRLESEQAGVATGRALPMSEMA